MKLNEIMMFKDVGDRTQLNIFQVDDDTLAKLTKIRGSLYKDDPRLQVAKDLPTPEPEIMITPEMRARAEASWRLHCMAKDAGTRAATSTPEPVLTFEEKAKEDWRTRPNIRAEFTSFGSYQAYKRAEKAGRTRVCGMS